MAWTGILIAMPNLQAINFLRELGGGVSRPCVFECSDGQERVLKFQDRAPTAALASDWIGALLATELGVRTPAPCLVHLDHEAIATMGPQAARDAHPGYAFGSAYLPSAQNVFGIGSITSCRNYSELLGSLTVLDTWIGTQDRLRPDKAWNLLMETDQGPWRQLVAIDFGMAFPGPLIPLVGLSDHLPLTPICPQVVRHLVDRQAVAETLDRAEGMNDAEIIKAVATTPDAWLSSEQRGRVIGFLRARRDGLRATLTELGGHL